MPVAPVANKPKTLTPKKFVEIKNRLKDLRYNHGEDIDMGTTLRLPATFIHECELMVAEIDRLNGRGPKHEPEDAVEFEEVTAA